MFQAASDLSKLHRCWKAEDLFLSVNGNQTNQRRLNKSDARV